MEETLFDERRGRIMNATLGEYHVPVRLDVPHIDTVLLGHADPHMPLGARGVGEIGITGAAAAVANTVYNATGKRMRDSPITLDKLQLLLHRPRRTASSNPAINHFASRVSG